MDSVGSCTSQSPSRHDFSALMSSASSVRALRSAPDTLAGSSPMPRYPGVPASRPMLRAIFTYAAGDPSMYTAPNTYTSEGPPHDSTFATGFPLSIAARCCGERPSWVKSAAGWGAVWASAADATDKTTASDVMILEIMAAPLNSAGKTPRPGGRGRTADARAPPAIAVQPPG